MAQPNGRGAEMKPRSPAAIRNSKVARIEPRIQRCTACETPPRVAECAAGRCEQCTHYAELGVAVEAFRLWTC